VAPAVAPPPPAAPDIEAPARTAQTAAQPATTAAAARPEAAPRAPAFAANGADNLLADVPRLLFGEAGPGGWLIVADVPPDMLGSYAAPLAGDEGRLLANMLKALRLDAGEVPVHLVRVHRGSPVAGDAAPQPLQDVLAGHAAAMAPGIVLALGPLAAQALQQRSGPIGKLRGEVLPIPGGPLAGRPAVASYPLAYLLRNGADKAKAWADLCRAAAAHTP